jgi:hypothetical protein
VDKVGYDLTTFTEKLRALPPGTLLRVNDAGDLPHHDGVIDRHAVLAIAKAAQHTRAFTYTHHATTPANIAAIRAAVQNGLVINLSANTPTQTR